MPRNTVVPLPTLPVVAPSFNEAGAVMPRNTIPALAMTMGTSSFNEAGAVMPRNTATSMRFFTLTFSLQ